LLMACGQGVVLTVVLLAAKAVVVSDPRVALLLLLAIGGTVSLALNLRNIRTLLAAGGLR